MERRYLLTALQLQHIEDMAAEGLSIAQIAEDLFPDKSERSPHKAFERLREKDPRIEDYLDRGKQRYKEMTDKERRRRLTEEQLHFQPTEEDLEDIKELCSLGWAEQKIAREYKVSLVNWSAAKRQYPELVEAIKEGQGDAGGRRLEKSIESWRPRRADLKKIEELAEKGLTLKSISIEMGLPTETLNRRQADVPEIREAFETGKGKLLLRIEKVQAEKALDGTFQERFFQLKTQDRNNWSERPPTNAEINAQDTKGRKKGFMGPRPLAGKDFKKEADKVRGESQKRRLALVESEKKASES